MKSAGTVCERHILRRFKALQFNGGVKEGNIYAVESLETGPAVIHTQTNRRGAAAREETAIAGALEHSKTLLPVHY